MTVLNIEYIPAGDSAIIVKFSDVISEDTHYHILSFTQAVENNQSLKETIIEIVPSYTDVTIYYQTDKTDFYHLIKQLKELNFNIKDISKNFRRQIEIPVCYGDLYGEDIQEVAKLNKISTQKLIQIHSSGTYLVYMLGFTPGFAYLGGMDERIATPRRTQPRTKIPAGSVGIAGSQTGIYPIESPGGWQIIGRTPLQLFNPKNDPPALINAGDRLKFKPIGKDEFENIKMMVLNNTYKINVI